MTSSPDPNRTARNLAATELLPANPASDSSSASSINTETTAFDTSSVAQNSAPAEPVSSAPKKQAPQAATAVPPKKFGRYRIEKLLGQGGMGSVFLAHDEQLDRPVALKIPRLEADAAGKLVARFQREARAVAQLRHPHICPVFDVGEIDGYHFLAMAYIPGQPLSAFLQSGKTQPERGIALTIYKIALALEEAHTSGILHRDLKPANVMIDSRGEPIVMDFGLSHRINDEEQSRLTQEGMVIGTPAYMAPEQIDGRQPISAATDIYSLGVVLYELLTGHCPFQGSMVSVIGQVLHSAPPPIAKSRHDVSPALVAICERAMAKEPQQRFPSMKEFAAALAAFLKGKTTVIATQALAAGTTSKASGGSNIGKATPQGAAAVAAPAGTAQSNVASELDDLFASESTVLNAIQAAPIVALPGQRDDERKKLWLIGVPAGLTVIILVALLVYAMRPAPHAPVSSVAAGSSANKLSENAAAESPPADGTSAAIQAADTGSRFVPALPAGALRRAPTAETNGDALNGEQQQPTNADDEERSVPQREQTDASETTSSATASPGDSGPAKETADDGARENDYATTADRPAEPVKEDSGEHIPDFAPPEKQPPGSLDPDGQPPMEPGGIEELREKFKQADRNSDGQLDPTELQLHIILRVDKNRDQQASLDEMEQAYQRLKGKLFAAPTTAEQRRLPRKPAFGPGGPPGPGGAAARPPR